MESGFVVHKFDKRFKFRLVSVTSEALKASIYTIFINLKEIY